VTSRLRQCLLERALTDSGAPPFAEARQRLDEERETARALAARERRLQFRPLKVTDRIVLGAIDAAISLLAIVLLLRTARPILGRPGVRPFAGWPLVYALFVAIAATVVFATMYYGGVALKEKTWVGTDSFIASPAAWAWTLVSLIGVVLMFAQPMALTWLLSRTSLTPTELQPLDPEGECGVGGYVTFLHTWTIIAVALLLVPAVVLIRVASAEQEWSQPVYLVPPIAGAVLTGVLVYRLVRNAIVLRLRYSRALGSLAATWDEVQKLKPAPDPTIPFIGENWWKLPATLGSLFVALWGVLEWTGAAKALIELVR
jgi:hypothetical protein